MDQEHYKPLNSANFRPMGSCTNYGWNSGGMKTSADNYTSYTMTQFRLWYVYRRRPKWFGTHEGDRYLGKLRWISRTADGKQWKGITQKGEYYDYKIIGSDEKQVDAIARDLATAHGFVVPWFYSCDRERHKVSGYHKSIRCTACKQTRAEVERLKAAIGWELSYPADKLDFRPRMPLSDAHHIAWFLMRCKCSTGTIWQRLEAAGWTREGDVWINLHNERFFWIPETVPQLH